VRNDKRSKARRAGKAVTSEKLILERPKGQKNVKREKYSAGHF
jgi:hypothetical protein